MKKNSFAISIVCLVFAVLFSAVLYRFALINGLVASMAGADGAPVVIVDAGHGGEDGGASALDKSNEKDYNLEIALKLEQILRLNGYNVIMTRRTDIMTCDDGLKKIRSRKVSDIHNRFRFMEEYPDALFVSIHQNKFSDTSQKGTQVFYSKNDPESSVLADCIQKEIVGSLQKENKRMIKPSGTEIYLLYHAKSPAILVECGFLSNYEDLQKLKNDEYKTQLALLIAKGIINYNSDR